MKGKFIPMTEKYKRKHYPEGYFAALTKTHVRAGIGLLIMAVPCLLIGIAGICGILWFFFNGGGTASDIFGLLILLLFPGAFLAIGPVFGRGNGERGRLWKRKSGQAWR